MKILVVTNLYPPTVIGGYEISCEQVVGALRSRGHDVRVLTSIPTDLADEPDHVIRTMRHPDTFSPDRPSARSTFWELEANLLDSGNVFALVSELKRFEPDVCYLWNLIGLGGAGLVATLEYLGMPWVWHLGDAVPAYLCIFEGHVLPIANLMSRRLSGRFVAVSQGLVNEIEHVVDLGDRVRLVPNWVVDGDDHTERTYSPTGIVRMCFAGRLVEEKGIFILIDALKHVREIGIDTFRLDLFGSGDHHVLQRAITAADLGDVVSLRGWLPQASLRRELRNHDLFALPTFSKDAFGVAPLEAAAEGCVPLISTPFGLAEWLIDGVDCLKAPRDPLAFADRIAAACRGEIDLPAIGRRAKAVVARDFALSRVVTLFEDELRAAAARRRRAIGDEQNVYKMAVVAEALVRSSIAPLKPLDDEPRS